VVTEPASGKAAQSTSYAYDAFGQRLLKQAPQGLRFYQYDQAGHLLEEGSLSNGTAVPERDYIYLGDRPVAEMLPSTGALFFLHADRLDTPQFATDTAQRAEWKAAYQPFGAIRPVILNLAQNLRFPGQYADQETGYNHNGFRTYDPSLGRYLETDPIGLKGGLNTYAYAGGNPLSFTDPSGLKCPCAGYLTIISSNRGNPNDPHEWFGHSWLDFKTIDGGLHQTYGTWMGGGFRVNEEASHPGFFANTSQRTLPIDQKQLNEMKNLLNKYFEKGKDAWQPLDPCSSFASNVWNKVTGESLNANGPLSNPGTLKQSIDNANAPPATVDPNAGGYPYNPLYGGGYPQ
jgi:RHS repeat-associated protein